MLALVQKYDLLPQKRDRLTAEELVEKIAKRISVETIDAEVKKETLAKPVLLTVAFYPFAFKEDESFRKPRWVAREMPLTPEEPRSPGKTRPHHRQVMQQTKGKVDNLRSRLAYRRAPRKACQDLPPSTCGGNNADISNINMQVRSIERQRVPDQNPTGGGRPIRGPTPAF